MTFSATAAALFAMTAWAVACLLGLRQTSNRFGLAGALTLVGCASLLATVAGRDAYITLPGVGLAGIEIGFRTDGLAKWFLAMIGISGLAVSVYAPSYLTHLRGKAQPGLVWAGLSLLFVGMTGVVCAANAIVFLAFWELMALSSFLLVATEHERQAVRRAAFIYLGATRIGSAFLIGGFIWAHTATGSWSFGDWYRADTAWPAGLMLVGLLTKAGCWPVHLWLPIAHPAAPAPVSALMSGVMIKTAIYAILRFFVLGGMNPPWMGWVLIGLGAMSALWGVLFALLQSDLKRMLAYSSVENIGLILLACGVAALAASRDNLDHVGSGYPVAQLALAAALLLSMNHAVFKTLLFLSVGTIDSQVHTREIDQLGGLMRRMPGTAAAFLVGCAAACALPPTGAFFSEWLLYKGLFNLASDSRSSEVRLVALMLFGWVGAVGALAFACFAKAFGIAFLGLPRSGHAEHARDGTRTAVTATASLAVLSVGFGLAGTGMLRLLANAGIVETAVDGPPFLLLGLLGAALGLVVWAALRPAAARRPERQFTTWDCGFGALSARTQYTGLSFTQPIARIFGSIYRYETQISVEGPDKRHFPAEVAAHSVHEAYLETRVYEPALKGILRFAEAFVMRLQAGSIHQYLLYMVLALGFLLWLGGAF